MQFNATQEAQVLSFTARTERNGGDGLSFTGALPSSAISTTGDGAYFVQLRTQMDRSGARVLTRGEFNLEYSTDGGTTWTAIDAEYLRDPQDDDWVVVDGMIWLPDSATDLRFRGRMLNVTYDTGQSFFTQNGRLYIQRLPERDIGGSGLAAAVDVRGERNVDLNHRSRVDTLIDMPPLDEIGDNDQLWFFAGTLDTGERGRLAPAIFSGKQWKDLPTFAVDSTEAGPTGTTYLQATYTYTTADFAVTIQFFRATDNVSILARLEGGIATDDPMPLRVVRYRAGEITVTPEFRTVYERMGFNKAAPATTAQAVPADSQGRIFGVTMGRFYRLTDRIGGDEFDTSLSRIVAASEIPTQANGFTINAATPRDQYYLSPSGLTYIKVPRTGHPNEFTLQFANPTALATPATNVRFRLELDNSAGGISETQAHEIAEQVTTAALANYDTDAQVTEKANAARDAAIQASRNYTNQQIASHTHSGTFAEDTIFNRSGFSFGTTWEPLENADGTAARVLHRGRPYQCDFAVVAATTGNLHVTDSFTFDHTDLDERSTGVDVQRAEGKFLNMIRVRMGRGAIDEDGEYTLRVGSYEASTTMSLFKIREFVVS